MLPLGAGTLIVNSGTIQVNGAASLADNVAFANNAMTIGGGSLAAGGTVAHTGTDILTVNNTTTINDAIGGTAARRSAHRARAFLSSPIPS